MVTSVIFFLSDMIQMPVTDGNERRAFEEAESMHSYYDTVGMVIVIAAMVVTFIGNLVRDRLELA
jgi:hypothetical protein